MAGLTLKSDGWSVWSNGKDIVLRPLTEHEPGMEYIGAVTGGTVDEGVARAALSLLALSKELPRDHFWSENGRS